MREMMRRKKFICVIALILAFTNVPITPVGDARVMAAEVTSPSDGENVSPGAEGDYYETKLSAKVLAKTVFQNQSAVPLAKITFTKPVTRRDLVVTNGSSVEDLCPLCEEDETDITYTYDANTQIVKVSVSPDAKSGKHSCFIYAAGANANSYRTYVEVQFTVLRRIDRIEISGDDFVCLNSRKGGTWNPKVVINEDAYKKKVRYELLDYEDKIFTESPVLKGYASLSQKNGSVKISKNFILNEDAAKNKFKLRVIATDYEGNETVGDSGWIRITDKVTPIARMIVIDSEDMNLYQTGAKPTFKISDEEGGDFETRLRTNTASPYDGQELANRYFVVVDRDGIPMKEVKWSVSGPVKMKTAYDGIAVALSTTGPGNVAVTATTRDGEKSTMRFIVALDAEPSLQVTWNYYEVGSEGERTFRKVLGGRSYNHPEDQPGNTSIPCDIPYGDVVNVYVGSQNNAKNTKTETENAFKISLEVEGAKIIRHNSYRDLDIVPTAKYTYIRMTNLAKKDKPVTLMILHNFSFDESRKKREVSCSAKSLYSGTWYRNDGTVGQDITVSVSKNYNYSYALVTLDQGKKYSNQDLELVGTYPLSNGQFTMSCSALKNGTIPLLVTFGELDNSRKDRDGNRIKTFTQSSKAIPLSIKVKNPAKPKLTVSNQLRPDGPHACDLDLNGHTRRSNLIRPYDPGIDGYDAGRHPIYFDQIRNVNTKGTYNDFTDTFVLSKKDGCIRLKDGKAVPKEGISGYVHYVYKVRTDDRLHYGWKKVLIKP